MSDGINVYIIGDFGPFSRLGKSIGYEIKIGQSHYILDCGAPIFQQIGGHGLKEVKGLIITHCHDDHKRWFSDLALFNMYAPDVDNKVFFFSSEDIHQELFKASGPALDRSLSMDSKKIIDIPYEDYVSYQIIGPRAKYKITSVDEGNGKTGMYVIDNESNVVAPDTAKIVISRSTKRPRMLFRDPEYGEWVEPESFYPFSSDMFFEKEKNIYRDSEGFSIEAIKAPVWHGVPVIGIKFKTDEDTLIFSSDTVNDINLWKELSNVKKVQHLQMSKDEFESAGIIYGDINDYIERVWSEERYREAVDAFHDAIVIHDISVRAGAVHTDYRKLKDTLLKKESVILTHAPDRITSEWVLCDTGKNFKIKGKRYFEIVRDKLYPMNADIYYKEAGTYNVGYRNEQGRHTVYEKNGLLGLSSETRDDLGTPLYNIDLYQDIAGMYFPKLEDKKAYYLQREDGKVELVEFTDKGSRGRIVEDHRERLLKR
jgi:ribonuclease BN (tRNA processing enzyme)